MNELETRNNPEIAAADNANVTPDARFSGLLIGSWPFQRASAVFRRTHCVARRRSWKIRPSMW